MTNKWRPILGRYFLKKKGQLMRPDLALAMPTPVRASLTDNPIDILRFAVASFDRGPVALATLIEIRGGAARSLGAQMAIAGDGRFCGYVSGGCVEAAVAAEALQAMAEKRDRVVKFGEGSSFFDVVLPCGGGITIAIHVMKDARAMEEVVRLNDRRVGASLAYSPTSQSLRMETKSRAGWVDNTFRSSYLPTTRVVVSGQAAEAQAVGQLASASSYDVMQVGAAGTSCRLSEWIDSYTAVVLLHHDIDAEADILETVLKSEAFYIGALGSTRTHHRRVERLKARSFNAAEIARIKAPIGMFGPTRDVSSLALSVLADVAAARLGTH
jgi:xanthine dehydrogenase accessory factor